MSYLKTRITGSRLLNAARILAFLELSRRLHQAYRFAYDQQAADQLVPQKSNCAEFVDNELISRATDLAYRSKDVLGRDLLLTIPRNQSEREQKYFKMPVSGFKSRLTEHQGGWVYAHIMGIAGGTLVGNNPVLGLGSMSSITGNQLVQQQMASDRKELSEVEEMDLLGFALYDYYGTLRPLKEVLAERRAEVADNEAGLEVGRILGDAMDRKISYQDARDKIFKLLCDY